MNARTNKFMKKIQKTPKKSTPFPTLNQVKENYISWVLDQCNGNKSKAAKVLGINRRTLHRIISERDAQLEADGSGL
jgi:DNA-binding protein Fis